MINPFVTINALKGRVIFRRLSRSKARTVANRIHNLRRTYKQRDGIPNEKVRKYIRLNLTHSIGVMLSDLELEQFIIQFSENEEFNQLWFYDPSLHE